MHPFGRIAVAGGIVLLVIALLWGALAPLIHYLAPFWPLIAVAAGIGILLWRFPAAQVQAIITQIMGVEIVRNLVVAAVLTTIYGWLLYEMYVPGATALREYLGVEHRVAWLIATLLGLPVIPVIWRLYAAAGIPGDPAAVRSGFRTLAVLTLAFFGWWYHETPNRLFDHANGKPLFWVAEKEGRVYFSPGYSPTTGEKLREGKPEDAAKFHKESWVNRISALWKERERVGTVEKNTTTYVVSSDTWTTVNLPPLQWFTFDSDKAVVIRLANGAEFVSLPDGKLLKNGREVPSVGDVIPGFKLSVRAKDQGTARFTLSVWPKK